MTGHPPATLTTSPRVSHSVKQADFSATGSWQTIASHGTSRLLWVGMLFSVGVHVVVLFGFNRHAKKAAAVTVDDGPVVNLVMPDLKDLEEPEPQISDEAHPVDAGISVPTLADVPTQVDLSSFVQEVDYSSLTPQQDLSNAKNLASIPTHIGHGGKIGGDIGKIFDLKDLDHNPEPTLQIAPVFPTSLKQAGMSAEVTVGFVVSADGLVVNPYVLKSTDHRFDDSALVAISKWKFRAGIKNGRKVNVRMAQPFPFVVRDES